MFSHPYTNNSHAEHLGLASIASQPSSLLLSLLSQVSSTGTFVAGLGSGVTEAVLVVTPAEVCKIRLQAQFHSMADPVQLANRKYKVS